ncbi:MAG: SMC-Scp complex subunit ScpB [Planctomycetota bacterium]
MDDISRDPHPDAHATPESGPWIKGPAPESVLPDQAVGERLRAPLDSAVAAGGDEETDRFDLDASAPRALPVAPRLPRVLPLAPVCDDEEDIDVVDDAVDDGVDDADAEALATSRALDGASGDEPGSELDCEPDREPDAEPGAGGDPEMRSGSGDGDDRGLEPAAPPAAADATLEVEEASAEPITDPTKLVRVVFGLLLTNRDGLSALRLAQACDTTQEAVRTALAALRDNLTALGAPLELTQSGESYKLWTAPDVFPYLERLRGIKSTERLSPAALETLAVVAYRQPVFRAEIEAVRGVKAGPMLRTLLDCKLIKVVGRADVPGRPLQYGTTQLFLERFGLSSLSDLPSVKEFKGLTG